ncbi:TcdA/TcdB catalytic glycosyltransferase domain-containing protein [Pelagibaculum spongiae]|uniref:GT44 domain-containing protein n=1 Tax=Pelagibaculum spongiae TaxID=2080658 RepID=A0A2V1GRU3_9GAMM|nr:TcdA/TcdB catalytic glycosyltransferase domain-containing protein [Pelagibaculum spongiae]PVZ63517.1 hypothetical protein DC094_20745 [Pelagibaculum spongiae]
MSHHVLNVKQRVGFIQRALASTELGQQEPFQSFFSIDYTDAHWLEYLTYVALFDLILSPQANAASLLHQVGNIKLFTENDIVHELKEKLLKSNPSEIELNKLRKTFACERYYIDSKLFNKPPPVNKPGEKCIHRIWLGGDVSDDMMTSIAAANVNIMSRWKGVKATRHYLWTNNKKMISGALKNSIFQIRDIQELLLFSEKKESHLFKLSVACLHLIERKEFAHAVDILRLLALYKYGGLYLDFSFHNSAPIVTRDIDLQIDGPDLWCFNPVQSDNMLLTQDFTSSAFEVDSRTIPTFNLNQHATLRSNNAGFEARYPYFENSVLYAGSIGSKFIGSALNYVGKIVNDHFFKLNFTHHLNNLLNPGFHEYLDLDPLAYALFANHSFEMLTIMLGQVPTIDPQSIRNSSSIYLDGKNYILGLDVSLKPSASIEIDFDKSWNVFNRRVGKHFLWRDMGVVKYGRGSWMKQHKRPSNEC